MRDSKKVVGSVPWRPQEGERWLDPELKTKWAGNLGGSGQSMQGIVMVKVCSWQMVMGVRG